MEKFYYMPYITDSIDIIRNYDFFVKNYENKIPGVLMIKSGKRKETEGTVTLLQPLR